MQTILYFIEVSCTGGAQNVLINILEKLDRRKYYPVIALLKKGWLLETLQSKGYEVIVLESSGRAFDWKLVQSLLRVIRQSNVKVVHAHLFDSGLYASIAGLLTRTPVLVTLHGQIDWKKSPRPFMDIIKRSIINYGVNLIIYVSEGLRKYYEILGLRKNKGVVIYNGIDLRYFSPVTTKYYRTELGYDSSNIVIGSIGNVKPWKGYEYLIEAAEVVIKRHPHVRFAIIGELDANDSYYKKLLEMIKEKKLLRFVSFFGYRSDIKEVLSAIDIFVLPSTAEGFSFSTIEAMAMNIPVIATRCGGPEEIIEHNSTGHLVPKSDATALGNTILQLIEKRLYLNEAFIEAARRSVEERFSVYKQVAAYEELYDNIGN